MKSLLTFAQYSVEDAQLIVICEGQNNTITATKNGITKYAFGYKDTFAFIDLDPGTWTIKATNGLKDTQKSITIVQGKKHVLTLSYNFIPEFTYTGNYKIVDDNDSEISYSEGNWKIRFLTSGTLRFTDLKSAENGIDIFMVGGGGNGGNGASFGGGGGGGSGYTKTRKNYTVALNTDYNIIVGGACGSTSAFSITAAGGKNGESSTNNSGDQYCKKGGNGGSGGGRGGYQISSSDRPTNGGSDGSYSSGTGQGTTTREFTDSYGTLYAGGGGGGTGQLSNSVTAGGTGGAGGGGNGSSARYGKGNDGKANTGGGAGGGGADGKGGAGGSGIVVIRNKR